MGDDGTVGSASPQVPKENQVTWVQWVHKASEVLMDGQVVKCK